LNEQMRNHEQAATDGFQLLHTKDGFWHWPAVND
jgi:hypothetical protein